MYSRILPLIMLLLFAWQPTTALAACKQKQIAISDFENASMLGVRLLDKLEQLNPRVAIVGRAGTDLSKYGLRYSHAGLVYREHPKGKWIFTHLLVRCKQAHSQLFDEGLITFFTDNPHKYEAVLMVPRLQLQLELEKQLLDGTARDLHEHRYSVIANPDNPVFQNSNQWVLEMIAVAKSIHLPSDQRKNAIFLAKEYGYQPDRIRIRFLKRHLAAMFSPNVHLGDHEAATKQNGVFPVVTVKSIGEFLIANNDVEQIVDLDLSSSSSRQILNRRLQTRPKRPTRIQNPAAANRPMTTANKFWN